MDLLLHISFGSICENYLFFIRPLNSLFHYQPDQSHVLIFKLCIKVDHSQFACVNRFPD
jgi:hypothetical protein